MTKRILWVEDEALKLIGLVRPLIVEGHTVDTAFSKLEAERKLTSGPEYDLVIIDLIIPSGEDDNRGGDKLIGVELIKKIKLEIKPQMPIIVVSVVNDTAVINGIKSLIKEYMPKGALRPSKLKKLVDDIGV